MPYVKKGSWEARVKEILTPMTLEEKVRFFIKYVRAWKRKHRPKK